MKPSLNKCTLDAKSLTQLALAPLLAALSSHANAANNSSGWEQDYVDVPAARELKLFGRGVDVGVIDRGFLPQHPAFFGLDIRPLINRTIINDMAFDSDLSIPKFGTDKKTGLPTIESHGASVSGIIASRTESLGEFTFVGGVAPGSRLFQTEVGEVDEDEDEDESDDNAVELPSSLLTPGKEEYFYGALSTLQQKAPSVRIISNSYNDDPIGETPESVDLAYSRIDPAAKHPFIDELVSGVKSGRLFTFAAGNESNVQPGLLATLPRYRPELESGFLSVVAVGADGRLTDYSNECGVSRDWCLAAPGDLYVVDASVNEDGNIEYVYKESGGTSFSTPLVSSSAALIAERFPYLSIAQVRMTLLTTASDLGNPGVDTEFGWGLLNLGKAIKGPAMLFGDQTLTMNPTALRWSGRDVWNNDITSGGTLTKSGAGTLTLAGNNRFSGVTVDQGELALDGTNQFSTTSHVRSGRLVVNGALTGPGLTVAESGELRGRGQVNAPTRLEGTLVVDREVSALSFTRSLELSTTSTLKTTDSQHAAIRLEGPAAFANLGGRIQLTAGPTHSVGTVQPLIVASQGAGYGGGFDSLQQAPGLAERGMRYDLRFRQHSVDLILASTELPGQKDLRGNTARTASALNALRDRPIALRAGAYNEWLQSNLSRGYLDDLPRNAGGQVYADSLAYLSRQPIAVNNAMSSELSNVSPGQTTRLWMQGLTSGQRNEGGSSASNSRERSDGIAIGIIKKIDEQNQGGATLAQTKGRVSSAGGKVEFDITQLSVGFIHAFDSLQQGPYLSGILGAGYFDATSKRDLTGFTSAKGDSNGQLYHASINVGYQQRYADWRIEPRIGLVATHTQWSDRREKNSELALGVNKASKDATFATVELSIGRGIPMGSWSVEPELNLGYHRSLSSRGASSTATLEGIEVKQNSAEQSRDLLSAGLAVRARHGSVQASLALKETLGEKIGNSAGATLKLSYEF